LSNSILDETSSCVGSFPSSPDGGYNVESDSNCDFTSSIVNSSTINVATALNANGSNGPETLAIDPTSSAYLEVPIGACTLAVDERGDARPGAGSSCDAGAFEYQAPPLITFPTTTTTTTTTPATDTLTFASDGGSPVSSVSGANGANVTLPNSPTFAGHVFKGWFNQASGGTLAGLAGATYHLTGSLTLYAQWTTIPVKPPHLVVLGSIHPFSIGSSSLTRDLRRQVAVFAKVIRARHYVKVDLEGEASGPVNVANQRLALARAIAVEAYLKSLGIRSVHYVLSAKVIGTTSASLVVVVASS